MANRRLPTDALDMHLSKIRNCPAQAEVVGLGSTKYTMLELPTFRRPTPSNRVKLDSSRSLGTPNIIAVWRLPVQQPGDAGPGGKYPGLFERPDYPAAPVAQIPQPEDLPKSPLRYACWPSRYFPRLHNHHPEKRVPKLSSRIPP